MADDSKKEKDIGVRIPAFGGKITVKKRPPVSKELGTD